MRNLGGERLDLGGLLTFLKTFIYKEGVNLDICQSNVKKTWVAASVLVQVTFRR